MKKVLTLSVCLLVAICISSISVTGFSFKELKGQLNENISYIFTSDGTLLIQGFGDTDSINKPWGYTYPIKNNPKGWFVKKVIIGEGITSICDEMFYEQKHIETVSFPETLERIGDYAFYNSSLTHVYIPENVSEIGSCAFLSENHTLQSFTVSELNPHFKSVDGVVYDKNDTTVICFPNGKTEKKFIVPLGISKIHKGAFAGSNLVELCLPSTLKEIEDRAFFWCYYLSEVKIPEGISAIPSGAFAYNRNLSKCVLPSSIVCFDGLAFSGCNSLKDIIFKEKNDLQTAKNLSAVSSKNIHYYPGRRWLLGTETERTYSWWPKEIIDIPDTWAIADIKVANNLGLITERTSYGYKSVITRSEFAELVVNMVEKVLSRELEQQENAFADTYNIAAEKAYAAGIVDGVGNNCFSPGQLVTREQIAAMLCRAITYIETKTGKDIIQLAESIPAVYADKADVSNWAVSSVATLNAAEIMKGTSDTILSPKNNTTVQEAILLIYRIYTLCT